MKSHLLAGCSLFRCPSRNRSSSFQTLCPLPSLYPIHPKNRTEIRPMGKGILWKGQNSKWSNQQSACKTCENQDKGYVKWSECSLSAIRAKEGAHWKERMEKGVCWKGRQEKGRSLKGRNLRIVNLWDLFIFLYIRQPWRTVHDSAVSFRMNACWNGSWIYKNSF